MTGNTGIDSSCGDESSHQPSPAKNVRDGCAPGRAVTCGVTSCSLQITPKFTGAPNWNEFACEFLIQDTRESEIQETPPRTRQGH
ncbi:hypothetical protein SAMN05216411_106132 [Nitrosospira multiformis]|nr:hypothetical protein SAMN05216411_106132 [Nitrosospira multiformis]